MLSNTGNGVTRSTGNVLFPVPWVVLGGEGKLGT